MRKPFRKAALAGLAAAGLLLFLAAGGRATTGFTPHAGAKARSTRSATVMAAAQAGTTGSQSESSSRDEWLKLINLIILIAALVYFLRKPAAEFFAARSRELQKAIEEGRAALEASEAKLAAVEEKLKHLEEEIGRFKESAARDMEAERDRLHERAAAEAERIVQFARVQIEAATRAAKAELKAFAADQVLALAERKVKERLSGGLQARLVSRFVGHLGRN